jgi:hypothetical protein
MRQPIAFANDASTVLVGLLAASLLTAASIALSILALRGRLRDA